MQATWPKFAAPNNSSPIRLSYFRSMQLKYCPHAQPKALRGSLGTTIGFPSEHNMEPWMVKTWDNIHHITMRCVLNVLT